MRGTTHLKGCHVRSAAKSLKDEAVMSYTCFGSCCCYRAQPVAQGCNGPDLGGQSSLSFAPALSPSPATPKILTFEHPGVERLSLLGLNQWCVSTQPKVSLSGEKSHNFFSPQVGRNQHHLLQQNYIIGECYTVLRPVWYWHQRVVVVYAANQNDDEGCIIGIQWVYPLI